MLWGQKSLAGAPALLRSDLGAHEYDVRNAETDGDQREHRRDVWPDQIQALTESKRRRQNAFGLALQSHTEDASRGIEQDANAFGEERARRDSVDYIFDISCWRASASGVVASGTIIPAIAELKTETNNVKKSQTAIDAKAAVTVF